MVTGDQELQWAYLLCPTFELSNSEGKPLTNGYIELYIAGTRDKYYAASDFAGTLHPFQIPLDSLGSNIVLVSPDNAYDIYVYNRFGNLVMSRYNVVPTNGAAGGGSSSSNISINSEDGTVVVTESTDPETGVKTFDLSVPSVSGNPSFWTGRGAATMGVTISDTEYHKLDISNHSIRNRNDDITVVDGEFNLKKGVYFWNVTVQLDKYDGHDNTRQRVFIESGYNRGAYTMDMTHDETETISFSGITVADYDDTKQDIKIKSEGESPFKASIYNVSIHKLNQNILGDSSGGHTYLPGDYIEITEDDVINVTGLTTPEDVEAMIDAAITAVASGDMYTGGDYINIENHVISVTGLQPEGDYLTQEDLEGYATETYVDNSVSSFTTHTEVYNATVTAIEVATGAIPDTEDVTFKELDITQFAMASAIPVVTGFATHTEVYEAVVTGVQLATSMIPDLEGYATEEYVTTYVDNSVSSFTTHTEVYDATVTAIEAATAAIPDSEEVEFEEINLEDYALASAIPDVSDFATHTEVYESTVTAVQLATAQIPDQLEAGDYISIENNTINVTGLQPEGDYATNADVHEATVTAIEHVTALIPEAQVQSDWTEADTTDPSYIQNKPEEVRLVAGDNINITETATSVVISASGGGSEYTAGSNIEINNDAISLKDVVHIDSRNEAPEGYILLGNIVHWGHDDYGPGIMIDATMDDYMDSRRYVWFNTSDQGREERFWGQYDYDRETMSVSGESQLAIEEGDIVYRRGDFDWTDNLPVIWSCSGMRYDIDRLQEAVTGLQPSDALYARSGVTTHSELNAAYDAGKAIYAIRDNIVFSLVGYATTGGNTGRRYYMAGLRKSSSDNPKEIATFRIDTTNGSTSTISYDSYTYNSLQANWNETNTNVASYIQNKPSIPTVQLNGDDQVTSINNHEIAGTGGSTYTAGQYISIDSNDVIAVTGLAPVSGSDGITVNDNVVSLDTPVEIVAGDNITISVTGASAIISAQGGGSTYTAGQYISIENDEISVTGLQVAGNYATQADVYVATVTGIQAATGTIPDSEEVTFKELDLTNYAMASAIPIIQLNSDDQVTAINNYEIVGGGTIYNAGEYISIDANNVISVTGVAAATAIPTLPDTEDVTFKELDLSDYALVSAVTGATQNMVSYTGNTAINHIELVSTLPNPADANTLYLIPEA